MNYMALNQSKQSWCVKLNYDLCHGHVFKVN